MSKHYAVNTWCQHKDAFASFSKGALAVLEPASADQTGLELNDLPACLCLPRAGSKACATTAQITITTFLIEDFGQPLHSLYFSL